MRETALKYGNLACKYAMKNYPAEVLSPNRQVHYHQGVFLSGVQKFNRNIKNKDYSEYVKSWVDHVLSDTDSIYDERFSDTKFVLDFYQSSILFFDLFEEFCDEKYKRLLDEVIAALEKFPVNKEGGFWHMECFPDQMWLDGLYMVSPVLTEYAVKFDNPKLLDIVALQAELMFKHCFDSEKKLMRHAWDCEKREKWADKDTGVSPECWGRAMGWYVVALTDILKFFPKNHLKYDVMLNILKELLTSLPDYQDESGLWYQVIDKGDRDDNWTELSCSMLFAIAYFRSIKRGYIDDSFTACVEKAFKAIISYCDIVEDKVVIPKVVEGTGVGDYNYYINRKTPINDYHGYGAFLLMCGAVLED